jgi:putative ABC transport system substrate-binding protein
VDKRGNRASAFATELIGSQPDVIFCSTTAVTAALHRETSIIPIVFAIVSDPVGSGFVAGLPRPGGNITGLTHIEAAMGGKWLSLLKEIAPGIKRAAFMFNPDTAPGGGKYFLASFEAAAGSLGIAPVAMPVRRDAEIETAIAALGAEQAGLVEFSPFMAAHVGTVISSAARHNVPAIFEGTLFASKGGLIAYGASFTDMFRPRGRLCRSHPARREAGRPTGADADEIRDDHQPENGKGARPQRTACAARHRG